MLSESHCDLSALFRLETTAAQGNRNRVIYLKSGDKQLDMAIEKEVKTLRKRQKSLNNSSHRPTFMPCPFKKTPAKWRYCLLLALRNSNLFSLKRNRMNAPTSNLFP